MQGGPSELMYQRTNKHSNATKIQGNLYEVSSESNSLICSVIDTEDKEVSEAPDQDGKDQEL